MGMPHVFKHMSVMCQVCLKMTDVNVETCALLHTCTLLEDAVKCVLDGNPKFVAM